MTEPEIILSRVHDPSCIAEVARLQRELTEARAEATAYAVLQAEEQGRAEAAEAQRDQFKDRLFASDCQCDPPGSGEEYCNRACEVRDLKAQLAEMRAALEREKRNEWHEGMVSVIDYDGNYLGCMGQNAWRAALASTPDREREERNG